MGTITRKNKTNPLIFNRQFKDIKQIGASKQSQLFDYQYPIVKAAFNCPAKTGFAAFYPDINTVKVSILLGINTLTSGLSAFHAWDGIF